MQTCQITVADYQAALPHWRVALEGKNLVLQHPAGVVMRTRFNDRPTAGDKAEILKAQVEHFCELATRYLKRPAQTCGQIPPA